MRAADGSFGNLTLLRKASLAGSCGRCVTNSCLKYYYPTKLYRDARILQVCSRQIRIGSGVVGVGFGMGQVG